MLKPVSSLSRVALVGLVIGCTDNQGPGALVRTTLTPLIVSNPAVPDLAPQEVAPRLLLLDSVVYVSLPPGSIPDGERIEVTNPRLGASVSADLVNGGFDPVTIEASAGDTLEILIHVSGQAHARSYSAEVPDRRRPRVVRTDPPPGKVDVPLNAGLLVVFSEPIDAGTLVGAAVKLTTNGVLVQGTLEFGDAEQLSVRFTPTVPLAAGAVYTLSVTQQLQDFDGDSLEAPVSVDFIAASGSAPLPGIPASAGFILSEPSGGPGGLVYASLLPYTRSAFVIEDVIIKARRTGAQATATTVNGGFDPIVIAAAAGDTLDIHFQVSSTGTSMGDRFAVVPSHRPPRVVRSDPPSQMPDVAFDAGVEVVFSEPIDPLTLTASTVQLSAGGVVVAGTVQAIDPAHLRVGFTPVAPLASRTSYTLNLAAGVQDAGGEGLVPVSIEFVTRDTATGPPPSGGQIAFSRQGQIWLVNSDGTGLVQLTAGPGDYGPAWAPDGSRMAFTRNLTQGYGIYVVNADGSGLTLRQPGGAGPSWSPDGQWIAFSMYSSVTSGQDIFRMPAQDDGSSPVGLTQEGWEGSPTWSPDGARILFSSDRELWDITLDLFTVAPDGTGLTQLTHGMPASPGPIMTYHPASWSPDGQRLAAVRCDNVVGDCVPSRVVVMNADGTGEIPVASATRLSDVSWSPDGQTIAFTVQDSSGWSIRWVTPDGSRSGLIVADGASAAWRP